MLYCFYSLVILSFYYFFTVEKALPKVVPSLTVIEARKLFHESRENGVAIVIITVKVRTI